MKIGNHLHFAPNLHFDDIDLTGVLLPQQYLSRIEGYYIEPAVELSHQGYGFACGLLIVSCIDSMSRLIYPRLSVGDRFISWVNSEIPGFSKNKFSSKLYYKYRNGLVHEGRIKDGAEFDLSLKEIIVEENSITTVNPFLLTQAVRKSVNDYVDNLDNNEEMREQFTKHIVKEFSHELKGLIRSRQGFKFQ